MTRSLVALLLGAALYAAPASAYHLEGGRWPTHVITYHTDTAAYSWSVDAAAYAWNTSGADIHFVKTSRRNAKVLVGIRWYKHAGDADIKRLGSTFVSAKVGIQTGHDRYEMALIVAHEFGHVLGLDHEFDKCATMNPSIGDDHTSLCPAPPPAMWTCRLLQYDDVRGAVALYGGTVKPWSGSSFCYR
jgi:hypothetical protein